MSSEVIKDIFPAASPGSDSEIDTKALGSHPWLKYQNDKYRNGRDTYMDIYGKLAHSVAQWRLMTFACLITLILSVLGNIYMSTSSKVQPYVVQVDSHGYAIPVEPVGTSNIDYRVISSQIAQFIYNMRVRVRDVAAQMYFSRTSYKSIAENSPALSTLNQYYIDNMPTANNDQVTDVVVTAIVPITADTYQAEWNEMSSGSSRSYKGVFEVSVSPPEDVANLINNPLGVYILSFAVHETLN